MIPNCRVVGIPSDSQENCLNGMPGRQEETQGKTLQPSKHVLFCRVFQANEHTLKEVRTSFRTSCFGAAGISNRVLASLPLPETGVRRFNHNLKDFTQRFLELPTHFARQFSPSCCATDFSFIGPIKDSKRERSEIANKYEERESKVGIG